MKRLLIALFSLATIGSVSAQCPGCAINMSCTGTTPTLCPTALPDGTQGQPYDQDLTFFLPQTFTDAGSGTNVTLQKIVVTGLSGIPSGLSWQSNSANNTYVVTSDPATQRGCAKVCGTPSLPGSYTITVSVIATVNTIVGVQNVPQSFTLPLLVTPSAGGNAYFSFNPSSGCGNVNVTYGGLVNIGMPQITEYDWNFDNGSVSTLQNPPVQAYTTPGEYHPTLHTNVYDLVLSQVSANVTGGWWQGIWPCNGTSIWFNFSDGVTNYSSGTSSSLNPTWSSITPTFLITNNLVTIDFKQKQGVCPTWDGGSMAVQINGPGVYNFTTTAVSNGGGGVSGSFTVAKQLFNSYVATDTIRVYELPPVLPITSSSNSFSMCSTNPITLSVDTGFLYQWYLNDTTIVVGADSSSYIVPDVSDYPTISMYKVKVVNPHTGCATFTSNVTVTINQGIPSSFSIYAGSNGLTTNYTYPTYQWLLNGTPLVPTGQAQTYVPVVNGNYSLVATTAGGCSDTSNVIAFFNLGVEKFNEIDQSVSVYPNPSNGEFTLSMNAEITGGLVVSMVDISGKTVYSENLGQMNGAFTKTFNLQGVASGVYTLNVAFEQGTVRRKIIIQ